MQYVAVSGLLKDRNIAAIYKNSLTATLASIAEPTTSKTWVSLDILSHTKKVISNHRRMFGRDIELYLDSGGFQIIVGYIKKKRIKEYIDTYHTVLEHSADSIENIFSLDINNIKFTSSEIKKLNTESIKKSIDLIKRKPQIRKKQIFVIQSRTVDILQIWRELMENLQVEQYYERYSFGGLVGLKSETRATFNHFVPMTFWLLSYLKSKNAKKPKHIHLLGQSSKLAIFTATILEKLFDVRFTMDSSELLRFTKITQKLPLCYRDKKNRITFATNQEQLADCLECYFQKHNCERNLGISAVKEIEDIKKGAITNETFFRLVINNITTLVELAHELIEENGVDYFINCDLEQLKKTHVVFQQGRLAVEFFNNMKLIKQFLKIYNESDSFEKINSKTENIIRSYYDKR